VAEKVWKMNAKTEPVMRGRLQATSFKPKETSAHNLLLAACSFF
jgi:hypothetical protein